MWSLHYIADALAAGLRLEERRLNVEHAVYGLDARDELSLQPLLAQSLESAGYGVYREQRYPACRSLRKVSVAISCSPQTADR